MIFIMCCLNCRLIGLTMMIANIARKADVFMSSQSAMLLMLLLVSHLLTSVCHGLPAASGRHGDVVNPPSSEDADDDNEPAVFAVFERHNPISGNSFG